MPARHRRSNQRAVRFDGFYEDEYEALNDKGVDHMEIIDVLGRADEQDSPEYYPVGFQITQYP